MERNAFIRPAVAGMFSEKYIESRLNMDNKYLDPELMGIHRKLQQDLVGSVATPSYVIVDPTTGEKLGDFQIDRAGFSWESIFRAFEDWMEKSSHRSS